MEKKILNAEKLPTTKALVVFVISVVCTTLVFSFLYRFDNKYQGGEPRGANGLLILDGELPDKPLYLVDGWEFYQQKLLSPEDFAFGVYMPDKYIYIGQYGGFELNDPTADPFGCATYRLNIFTGSNEPNNYMLELPEIFSAYKCWVNGDLLAEAGEISVNREDHRPEITHRQVQFLAGDRIELIFAVSSYDNFYSGMIYPPAFGTVKAVGGQINLQIAIGSMMFLLSLAVGLFYISVGKFMYDGKSAVCFGVMCFLYAGSVSHVLIYFTQSIGGKLWYCLEDFCFYGMLLSLTVLYTFLYQPTEKRGWEIPLAKAVQILGAIACAAPFVLTFVFSFGDVPGMVLYSRFTGFYRFTVAVYLTLISGQAAQKGVTRSAAFMAVAAIFSVAVCVDTFVRLYEPIRFGWPLEIGGFAAIVLLGIEITGNAINNFKERQRFAVENQLLLHKAKSTERQLALQAEQFKLVTGHMDQVKKDRHDLRHQFLLMHEYLRTGKADKLNEYIESAIGRLTPEDETPLCKNHTASSVARHYLSLAKKDGIDVEVRLNLPEKTGRVSDSDLCVILGNLLENAVEACSHVTGDRRFIRVRSNCNGRFMTILVDNSFDGIYREENEVFYSRKRIETNKAVEGVGISSIRAIADKYEGQAEFRVNGNVFEASVVLKHDDF